MWLIVVQMHYGNKLWFAVRQIDHSHLINSLSPLSSQIQSSFYCSLYWTWTPPWYLMVWMELCQSYHSSAFILDSDPTLQKPLMLSQSNCCEKQMTYPPYCCNQVFFCNSDFILNACNIVFSLPIFTHIIQYDSHF